jgi:hypothetical protein
MSNKNNTKQPRERCKSHDRSRRKNKNAEIGYFEEVEQSPWVSSKESKQVHPIS